MIIFLINLGDLMNVLLNFEKSLSLEGKKEKAEALYGILPIVLNILQQALRKAKLNGFFFL